MKKRKPVLPTVEEVKACLVAFKTTNDKTSDAWREVVKLDNALGLHLNSSAHLSLRLALADYLITGEWPPRGGRRVEA